MTPTVSVPGYERADLLERALGDPKVDTNPLSFATTVALDERGAFPEGALDTLCDLGLHRYYVPKELGGKLDSYEALLWQLRAVGRRDYTAAVAHASSFLPAALVWCGGSEEQRRWTADTLLVRETLAIAFHERAHGNDALASEVRAVPLEGGYVIHGEKWGITNARRARALVLLARTDDGGGPRGFSLFLLDTAPAGPSLRYLERMATHGVRGLDIDGVRLAHHRVSASARIAKLGAGIETSLRCSQVTRTLSLGPLLGAMDTALRAVVTHLDERCLYGKRATELPVVAAGIADAFADLVLMECATSFATRAVHVWPERLLVWAAASKGFVTVRAERTLLELSVLMGSRFYLRRSFWHGIFEKIVRDAPMARVSHFGGVISISHLASALPRVYARPLSEWAFDEDSMKRCFHVGAALPQVDFERLRLGVSKDDPILAGLGRVLEALERGEVGKALAPDVQTDLVHELTELTAEVENLRSFLVSLQQQGRASATAPEMTHAAERHAALFAAGSAALFWFYNREALDTFGHSGLWLLPALRRVRSTLRPRLSVRAVSLDEAIVRHLRALVEQERALSIFAPPLAPRASVSNPPTP